MPEGARGGQPIPLGTDGYLDATLPGALPPPPYARFGEWPLLALLFVLAAGLASFWPSGDAQAA
jgi:apolipoprotein N-acyltransferase